MFVKIVASALIVALSMGSTLAIIGYCDQDLCGLTEYNHITCGATGAFSHSCPRDKREVEMTEAMKTQLLDEHNKKRNAIAGGNEPGYQTAAKMSTMVSDDG